MNQCTLWTNSLYLLQTSPRDPTQASVGTKHNPWSVLKTRPAAKYWGCSCLSRHPSTMWQAGQISFSFLQIWHFSNSKTYGLAWSILSWTPWWGNCSYSSTPNPLLSSAYKMTCSLFEDQNQSTNGWKSVAQLHDDFILQLPFWMSPGASYRELYWKHGYHLAVRPYQWISIWGVIFPWGGD